MGSINKTTSNSILSNPIKERIESVCNTILYSDNVEEVSKAYDIFFTQYRQMIINAQDPINLSCVEDVIYKILYDEIENKLETCLPKYSTFARFVAMIRDQERMRTYAHFAKVRSVRPLTKLKNYILIVAQTEEDFEKKNSYIKNVLHNCFIKEI